MIYNLDQYFYEYNYVGSNMLNYNAIEKAISMNGGHLSTVGLDEEITNLLGDMFKDIYGNDVNEYLDLINGFYFDTKVKIQHLLMGKNQVLKSMYQCQIHLLCIAYILENQKKQIQKLMKKNMYIYHIS